MSSNQSFKEYCDSLSEWVKQQKTLLQAWSVYQNQLTYPGMLVHMYASSQASRKVLEESQRVTATINRGNEGSPVLDADNSDASRSASVANDGLAPPPPPPPFDRAAGAEDRGPPGGLNVPRLNPNIQEENIGIQGRRYKIPHPWKRIIAELIDYALLFFCRVICVSLITGDISHSLERHRLDAAAAAGGGPGAGGGGGGAGGGGAGGAGGGGGGEGVFLDGGFGGLGMGGFNGVDFLTTEILVAEVLNRLVVTIFETVCLSRGLGGRLGGSTPGKLIMGLRVVSCAEVYDFVEHVEVLPGENPGLLSSFVRSIIKNFALVFFFPICLTTLFFQHNRSTYDIISGTLVVSDMFPVPRRQQQQQQQQQQQVGR